MAIKPRKDWIFQRKKAHMMEDKITQEYLELAVHQEEPTRVV